MTVIPHIVYVKQVGLIKSLLVISPMAGFLGTDLLTGNVTLGLIVSGLFSMITAIFVTRPKVIAAKAAAMVNTTQSQDLHMATMFQRMNDIHKNELAFWQDTVHQQKKTEALIRVTKHNAFSAYQSCVWMIRDMQEQMKLGGMQPPPFAPKTFHEITGKEDAEMIRTLFPEAVMEGAKL